MSMGRYGCTEELRAVWRQSVKLSRSFCFPYAKDNFFPCHWEDTQASNLKWLLFIGDQYTIEGRSQNCLHPGQRFSLASLTYIYFNYINNNNGGSHFKVMQKCSCLLKVECSLGTKTIKAAQGSRLSCHSSSSGCSRPHHTGIPTILHPTKYVDFFFSVSPICLRSTPFL